MTYHGEQLVADTEGFTASGRPVRNHAYADYWLAGVWTRSGLLVWSSAPESYAHEVDAQRAARTKRDELYKQ
jgi:hypothetical protein